MAVDTAAGNEYFNTLPAVGAVVKTDVIRCKERVFEGFCFGADLLSCRQAMFSLIFNGCFNNNLVEMARLAFQDDVVVGLLFAGFLLIAPLTVMNLLLGVLVEVVRVVATAEQEGRVVRNLKEELHYAKEAMGSNDTTISQEERHKWIDSVTTTQKVSMTVRIRVHKKRSLSLHKT